MQQCSAELAWWCEKEASQDKEPVFRVWVCVSLFHTHNSLVPPSPCPGSDAHPITVRNPQNRTMHFVHSHAAITSIFSRLTLAEYSGSGTLLLATQSILFGLVPLISGQRILLTRPCSITHATRPATFRGSHIEAWVPLGNVPETQPNSQPLLGKECCIPNHENRMRA